VIVLAVELVLPIETIIKIFYFYFSTSTISEYLFFSCTSRIYKSMVEIIFMMIILVSRIPKIDATVKQYSKEIQFVS
jgi:hypothetical protein